MGWKGLEKRPFDRQIKEWLIDTIGLGNGLKQF